MNEPVLSAQDRNSACWQKVEGFIDEQLAKMRLRNDTDITEHQTARLRGFIACLKAMKSLNSDAPLAPSEDAMFKNLE